MAPRAFLGFEDIGDLAQISAGGSRGILPVNFFLETSSILIFFLCTKVLRLVAGPISRDPR